MTLIAILLDGNAGNMVCTGQLVTGHVHIEATEQIKMRGVRLELHGKSYVHWTTGSGDDERDYTGREEYLNLEIYLAGSRNNPSDLYLQSGAHDFPFTFVMPPELPQSFESVTGHVRYTAKAVIDRPMRIDDTAEVAITVLRLLDLNRESPHLREPLSMHNESPAVGCCCCCCISGVVEMNLRVNKGCFVPGETILVEGEICNRSSSNVKSTTISLVQKIIYFESFGGRPSSNHTERVNVLGMVQRPGLAKGQSDTFQNIAFVIPFVPPSRLDGCNIIHIVYYIELKANFISFLTFSVTNCEVVIGNVPLQNGAQPPVITNQPMPFPTPQAYPPPTSGFTVQAPPTFPASAPSEPT